MKSSKSHNKTLLDKVKLSLSLSRKSLENNSKFKNQSGFTIVELLVVIVVIGILASITIVSYTGIANKARAAALQSDLTNANQQLALFNIEYGYYPTTIDCGTADSSTNKCIKSSSGTTLTYQPSSTSGATSYHLYATNSSTNYFITDNSVAAKLASIVCPSGFIVVPGSPTYGVTSDFCVAKYEAKIQGNDNGNQTYSAAFVPESRASGTPWVNITQTNAITEAATTCSGCHLITEAEWMTIAQNVLQVPSNWSSGTVGSGYIYSGHNDNSPANALAASANDGDGYSGTGNSSGNQRRTLTLSNGEVIWDMAGDVWEWTSATVASNMASGIGQASESWYQWTTGSLNVASLPVNPLPSFTGISGAGSWNDTNGIGKIYADPNDAWPSGTTHAFLRGGYWGNGGCAGVLTLALYNAPSTLSAPFGFRVSR